MPMPTSEARIAIRSFAPSPHIPTFDLRSPQSLEINDLLLYYYSSICLNFITTRALFYGEILANNFIFKVTGGGGANFKKSLSIAIG
jgi:hypothetical protein